MGFRHEAEEGIQLPCPGNSVKLELLNTQQDPPSMISGAVLFFLPFEGKGQGLGVEGLRRGVGEA